MATHKPINPVQNLMIGLLLENNHLFVFKVLIWNYIMCILHYQPFVSLVFRSVTHRFTTKSNKSLWHDLIQITSTSITTQTVQRRVPSYGKFLCAKKQVSTGRSCNVHVPQPEGLLCPSQQEKSWPHYGCTFCPPSGEIIQRPQAFALSWLRCLTSGMETYEPAKMCKCTSPPRTKTHNRRAGIRSPLL